MLDMSINIDYIYIEHSYRYQLFKKGDFNENNETNLCAADNIDIFASFDFERLQPAEF